MVRPSDGTEEALDLVETAFEGEDIPATEKRRKNTVRMECVWSDTLPSGTTDPLSSSRLWLQHVTKYVQWDEPQRRCIRKWVETYPNYIYYG